MMMLSSEQRRRRLRQQPQQQPNQSRRESCLLYCDRPRCEREYDAAGCSFQGFADSNNVGLIFFKSLCTAFGGAARGGGGFVLRIRLEHCLTFIVFLPAPVVFFYIDPVSGIKVESICRAMSTSSPRASSERNIVRCLFDLIVVLFLPDPATVIFATFLSWFFFSDFFLISCFNFQRISQALKTNRLKKNEINVIDRLQVRDSLIQSFFFLLVLFLSSVRNELVVRTFHQILRLRLIIGWKTQF